MNPTVSHGIDPTLCLHCREQKRAAGALWCAECTRWGRTLYAIAVARLRRGR